jgi:predicted esterase
MRPALASIIGVLVALGLGASGSNVAQAMTRAELAPHATQPAWCAPEFDALPGNADVCHIQGTPSPDGRRTLVVFLHGVIAKNTTWQWLQERGIARSAKQLHFEVIVPQGAPVGVNGSGGFAWPGGGGGPSSDNAEKQITDGWKAAQATLEARNGHAFDEVFVVGFSSGAYFASSLALRSKLDVQGYVVLAGGAARHTPSEGTRRVPVFVGVSATDRQTAPGARALGYLLTSQGWPSRVDEQPVGHMVSDVHMAHALGWLRGLARPGVR